MMMISIMVDDNDDYNDANDDNNNDNDDDNNDNDNDLGAQFTT